jgi:hypothetical protein
MQPSSNDLTRRQFLRTTAAAAAAAAAVPIAAAAEPDRNAKAETLVREFAKTLTAEQKKNEALLPWNDPRRTKVANNWQIIKTNIGTLYTPAQQDLLKQILRNVTSEVGYDKLQKQMKDDMNGIENFSACIFGDPEGQCMWVLTGRHLTIRAAGDSMPGACFGGPIFYGHAVEDNEKPDHPGNVWWHQARLANKVFEALNPDQRKLALRGKSPNDDDKSIELHKREEDRPGLPLSTLTPDQRELFGKTARSLLEPFRKEDVDDVISSVHAHGGLDKCRLSFFEQDDLGKDGIWDNWKLEGPVLSWYFRGNPHVHTWVRVNRAEG